MHILALLDIKKMIPVPDGEFERIEFNEIDDLRYKSLLQKEYAFCLKIKDKLFKKVNKIYRKQINEGKVKRAYCNFLKLEEAMLKWK